MNRRDITLSDEQQIFIDTAKARKTFSLTHVSAAEKLLLFKDCVANYQALIKFFILHTTNCLNSMPNLKSKIRMLQSQIIMVLLIRL